MTTLLHAAVAQRAVPEAGAVCDVRRASSSQLHRLLSRPERAELRPVRPARAPGLTLPPPVCLGLGLPAADFHVQSVHRGEADGQHR